MRIRSNRGIPRGRQRDRAIIGAIDEVVSRADG
jgi:hypothetical protein